MTSTRSRCIVAGAALAALVTFKWGHFQYETTAAAGPVVCTVDTDCAQECSNTVSNFAYKCVSATQVGMGFNNRCAWLTVSSKQTPPGVKVTTLYNDTTRTGVAYQPCVQ